MIRSRRGACLKILAVVAGLAALIIVGFFYYRSKMMRDRCVANVQEIGQALQTYATQHQGVYPKDLESLRKSGQLKGHKTCHLSELPSSYDQAYKLAPDSRSCTIGCDNHPLTPEHPNWESR